MVRSLSVCLTVAGTACSAGPSPAEDPAGPAVPSADHHAHIRSGSMALHQDRMDSVLDGRRPETPAGPILAADLVAALDRAGVERALVLSNAYMLGMPDAPADDAHARVVAENDYVASEVARFPERLTALCSINPMASYAVEEVRRCVGSPGVAGLKLHLANSDMDLRNAEHLTRLDSVFAVLSEARAGVLIHMRTRRTDYGAEDARRLINAVLAHHADVPVLVAHAAGWGGYDDATDAALGAFSEALREGTLDPERIWFGIGAVVFQPEAAGADSALAATVRAANAQLANRIREIGPDRFVYATDWPGWPPIADRSDAIAANIRLIRAALPLEEDELARVFSATVSFLSDTR